MAVVRFWPGSMVQPWPTWALVAIFLSVHTFMPYALLGFQETRTPSTQDLWARRRTTYFVQLENIIANDIYRKNDNPLYKRGNMIPIVFCSRSFTPPFGQSVLCMEKLTVDEQVECDDC